MLNPPLDRNSLDSLQQYLSRLSEALNNPSVTSQQRSQAAQILKEFSEFLTYRPLQQQDLDRFAQSLLQLSNTASHSATQGVATQEDIPQIVYDGPDFRNANAIRLGRLLGAGGEGAVYQMPAQPGMVAKIFHIQKITHDQCSNLEKKLHLLLKKQAAMFIDDVQIAAFPEQILYRQDGTFAGYSMRKVCSNARLYTLYREDSRRSVFPDIGYRELIAFAYNLAEAVAHLHSHDIIIGDLNVNNVILHPDGTLCLIDCNSFDLTDPDTGVHYPCTVGQAEILAPELQIVGKLSNGRFTKESDCFSLAIHLFRLLMNNADPFGFQYIGDPTMYSTANAGSNQAIINGECCYVRQVTGKQIPTWSTGWDALPRDIRQLFDRVFHYDRSTAEAKIAQRPTAKEWMDALMRFYQSFSSEADSTSTTPPVSPDKGGIPIDAIQTSQ